MTVNVLFDKDTTPGNEQIAAVLQETWTYCEQLLALTRSCEQDWKHYGKKYGWKLKVHAGGKTLLELTVADGWFLVSMAIRDKERKDLIADPAAGELAGMADAAAAFPEGHAIKVEVRDPSSFQRASALVQFIMARRSL